MIKTIKAVIAKIKERRKYIRCYDHMESIGIAVFCMCAGDFDEDYRHKVCLACPYFTPIRKDGADNDR